MPPIAYDVQMEHVADLSEVLTGALRELNCPGILCAINRNGNISTHSAGVISAEEHETPFYIYSITKSYTATAILLLCEQQGCFLDAPVGDFLRAAPIPREMTVRQVLNHTSGLSDYFWSAAYREAVRSQPENPWPYEKLMRVGLERTPLFAPGCGWAYSNPGYALLNELIAERSGQSFFDYLQSAILNPLGLSDTHPFVRRDLEGRLLAADEPSIEGDFRRRYDPGWILPSCLISTAADVTRFYDALFAGKLLSAKSLEQMTTTVDLPVPPMGSTIPAQGLGLMHGRNDPLGDSYGHGGGGPGYTTYAKCFPSLRGARFSFCLVINKSLPATPFALGDQITRAFLEGLD
jgi:D-alanyl-D-alanine carboxypeptidase